MNTDRTPDGTENTYELGPQDYISQNATCCPHLAKQQPGTPSIDASKPLTARLRGIAVDDRNGHWS